MTIAILPVTSEDVPEMIDVGMKAFAKDPLAQAAFNTATATPDQIEEYKQWRVDLARLRIAGPGKHYFKAVDEETGAIVGYAGLNGPDVKRLGHNAIPSPNFYDLQIDEELRSKMQLTRDACISGREDLWCKSVLFQVD